MPFIDDIQRNGNLEWNFSIDRNHDYTLSMHWTIPPNNDWEVELKLNADTGSLRNVALVHIDSALGWRATIHKQVLADVERGRLTAHFKKSPYGQSGAWLDVSTQTHTPPADSVEFSFADSQSNVLVNATLAGK